MSIKWEKTRTPGVYRRDGVRGRHYRHMYRDSTGRQAACSTCQTLDTAEDHQRRMRSDKPHDVAAGRKTLREVYDEMVAAATAANAPYAANTLDLHAACWRHLDSLTNKQVNKITARAVTDALKGIGKPAMRDKTRKLLSRTYAFAIHRHYVSLSPVTASHKWSTRAGKMRQQVEEGKISAEDILSEEGFLRLVAETPDRYKALVRLMAASGLRPGEAVSLTVGKLKPLRRELLVDTSLTGFTKTGKTRTIKLPTCITEMLVAHIEEFSDPSDPEAPMFPREDGTIFRTQGAYDWWAKGVFGEATKRAGIDHGLSPNDLRHMAAARAIARGADVYVVAKMLGHEKPSITLDIYGSLWPNRMDEVADALDEYLRVEWAKVPQDAQVVRLS